MTPDLPETSRATDGRSAVERFCLLFEQHGRAIYGHVRSLVPHASDADEVFQETCVTLWQKFDQYRPGHEFPRLGVSNRLLQGAEAPRSQVGAAAIVQPAVPRPGERGVDCDGGRA